jgi:hypothetical protein
MKARSSAAFSRRNFLKLAALGLGGLAFQRWNQALALPSFPAGERLGRVNVGQVDLKALPDVDSQTVGVLYEDAVVPWLRELVGKNVNRTNQRWVETPDGYIWSPYSSRCEISLILHSQPFSKPTAKQECGSRSASLTWT